MAGDAKGPAGGHSELSGSTPGEVESSTVMADFVAARLSPSTVTAVTTSETAVLTSPNAINLGTAGQPITINGTIFVSAAGLLATEITVRVRQGTDLTGEYCGDVSD